jgi:hypothetical protein
MAAAFTMFCRPRHKRSAKWVRCAQETYPSRAGAVHVFGHFMASCDRGNTVLAYSVRAAGRPVRV